MTTSRDGLDQAVVVVTRAAEQAASLVAALEARGARTLEVPLITIVDDAEGMRTLRAAIAAEPRPDAVVVTSPNGARCLVGAGGVASGSTPPVYVVGPGTQAALEAAGGPRPAGVATDHRGEGVVALLGQGPGHAVVAQGDLARATVVDGLRAAGWDVTPVVVYRTQSRRPAPEVMDRALAADVVTLASGSAARAWARACDRRVSPPVVAMGAITAAEARRAGLVVAQVAEPQTVEGLVEATVRAVRGARPTSAGPAS